MKVKVLNDMTLVLKTGQTVDIDDEQYQLVSQFVEKIDDVLDEVVETDKEETTENEVLDKVVETDASVKKITKINQLQKKAKK